MAAKADVFTVGGEYRRSIANSVTVPTGTWDDLQADIRKKRLELYCPTGAQGCGGGLNVRRSYRGTQHFTHLPGEGSECVNRSHESVDHQEMADQLAEDIETVGGRAQREWSFDGGRADVAAWPAKGLPIDPPSSIIEYQRQYQTLDDFRQRDAVRMGALNRDSRGNWGRRTVIWVAKEVHDSSYQRVPQLYLNREGTAVNDGAYYQAELSTNDRAQPVVIDRVEALRMAMEGLMIRVEGQLWLGGGEYGDAWVIRPGGKANGRSRRRRALLPDLPGSVAECDRPVGLSEARSRLTGRHPACSVCGKPMMFGQKGAHLACGGGF